jgi:hypothetical protein
MQFGKSNTQTQVPGSIVTTGGYTSLTKDGSTGLAASLAANIAVGPGKVNFAALYLSGDRNNSGYNQAWQPIGNGVTYFAPANMWLLTRNAATINTSTAIGGSSDITRGGRGIRLVSAGFEGTADKIFYSANAGYAGVDQKRTASSSAIGGELNATIGYKLYTNLSASATGAVAILGNGYAAKSATSVLLPGGAHDPDAPFMGALALNYTF